MLDERWGGSARPASRHAASIIANASRIADSSPSRVQAPSTPAAHRAARATDFGPIDPAMSGGPPAWTGGGPTGSAPANGGSARQMAPNRSAARARPAHARSKPAGPA